MSNFTPTRRGNPCEVCGNDSGKCRQHADGEIILCMSFADAKLGEIQSGFKCIKIDSGKGWATFKLDNSQEWSEEQQLEWRLRREVRQQQRVTVDADRRARSLPVEERDRLYCEVLGQLSLHPEDRADLQRRGFTEEQIEQCGFKSVQQWQKIEGKLDPRLPGAKLRNLICLDGYLIPVRDVDGLIVACQLRLSHPDKDGNRYRWLSSSNHTVHLYPDGCEAGGEMPLAVYLPQELKSFEIGICEGTGAKPYLTAQRLGIPVIGAAGGAFPASQVLFESTLQKLSEALCHVAQANGCVSTDPQNQLNLIEVSDSLTVEETQISQLQTLEPEFVIPGTQQGRLATAQRLSSYLTLNSPQQYNQQPSISSPTTANLTLLNSEASTIPPSLLAELVSAIPLQIFPDAGDTLNRAVMSRWHGVADLLKKWGWSISFAWWNQLLKTDSDIDELTSYEGIERLKPEEFFKLAEGAEERAEKAEAEQQRQRRLDAEEQIYQSLTGITERPWKEINQPLLNLEELGLEPGAIYILQSAKGTGKTQGLIPIIGQYDGVLAWFNRVALGREECHRIDVVWKDEVKSYSGRNKRGFCSDSAPQFNPNILAKNGLLLADECDQVFDHNFGDTCNKGGKRPLILATLEAHTQSAIAGNGIALFMSADVSQKDIDYVKALAPEGCPVRLIVNHFKPERGDVHFDESDLPDGQVEELIAKLEAGQPCFVIDDIKNGVRGCKSIAEYIRTIHPEWTSEIVEINSDTSGSPEIIEYLKGINKASMTTRLVCCSPSVVSGISITNGRFVDGVFGFFNGVLTINNISQAIARVRGAKNIYIWTAEKGLIYEANRALDPAEIKAYYQRNYEANCKHIIGFGAEYDPITGEWDSPHFDLFCKNAAYRNLCMNRLRERLRARLEQEGYTILSNKNEGSDIARNGLKESWNKVELAHAHAVADANILDEEQLETLQMSSDPHTPEQKLDLEKTYLLRSFGPELIEATTVEHESGELLTGYAAMTLKNERGVYRSQLEAFYLLTSDQGEAIAKDLAEERKQEKWGEGRFPGDVRWRTRQKKAREFLRLQDFLDPEKWYSPVDFAAIAKRAKNNAAVVKDALNLSVENISPGQIFGELLGQIGLSLDKKWAKTAPGARRFKLRKIGAESWNHAQMYVRYRESLKAENQPQEGGVSVASTAPEVLITPSYISIESQRGGDQNQDAETQTEQRIQVIGVSQWEISQNQAIRVIVDDSGGEWLDPTNLKVMAADLELITGDQDEGPALFEVMRQIWPKKALQAASKLLGAETREKLKEWILGQNQTVSA